MAFSLSGLKRSQKQTLILQMIAISVLFFIYKEYGVSLSSQGDPFQSAIDLNRTYSISLSETRSIDVVWFLLSCAFLIGLISFYCRKKVNVFFVIVFVPVLLLQFYYFTPRLTGSIFGIGLILSPFLVFRNLTLRK